MSTLEPHLKRVYWETTAGCNLRCIHCRRLDILDQPSPDELTTSEAKAVLGDLKAMGRPVVIFSGGEPLYRKDIFEVMSYAKNLGLPVALATNGTLVDRPLAQRIKDAGVYYASISLDGARAASHESFRGPGTFEQALRGFRAMRDAGIKVQINFTVTRANVGEVADIRALARAERAIALYLFLLVPVGCGVQIAPALMLNAEEVEAWLQWVREEDGKDALPIKAICAPQIYRLENSVPSSPSSLPASLPDRKGCLAGIHMCFISHQGDVYPCGYLPLSAGNVRQQSIRQIWESAPLLAELRDPELLQGRCGACEFKFICGGCRARAYHAYGTVQGEEPYCVYQPA